MNLKYNKTILRRIIIFLILFFFQFNLFGQRVDGNIKNDSLTFSSGKISALDEVIVHPAKRERFVSDIPQKIDVITAEGIQLNQPQTAADLVGTCGEVFIQKSQMGGGSPMIRGFSANRIVLVVDGIRMNNATYRSGNLQNIISLDAAALEQTEIFFGPGSVVYGSDALGGVIYLHTLKPRLSKSGLKMPVRVTSRFSSANMEITGHIDVRVESNKLSTVSSISYSDYGDMVMGNRKFEEYKSLRYVKTINGMDEQVENPNPNKQVYTAYSQLNLMQKIRFKPNDYSDFEYSFHYSISSDIPRYDRLIEYSGSKLKYAQWYYGPQKWMMHALNTTLSKKNPLWDKIVITSAYQHFTESRNDRKLGKVKLNSRVENVDIYSLNIDADKPFSKSQSICYGVEGLYNLIHSEAKEINSKDGLTNSIPTRYPDGSSWWSISAYSLYEKRVVHKATFQAGVRYNVTGMKGRFNPSAYGFPFESFNNVNDALTCNIGLSYSPSPKNRLALNLSTGFRAPNIDDAAKVFDSEPGTVIIPNPNLKPEYATTLESGWNFTPSKIFSFELSLYYTRLNNAMVRREGQLNGLDSIMYDGTMSKINMLTNTSWANIIGLSSRFKYEPFSNFICMGGINWQKGKDNENFPLRHVAPLFGDFHIRYVAKNINVDLYTLFNGQITFENLAPDERSKPAIYAKDSNGNPFSPAWMTLNIKSKYQVNKSLDVSAGIENLLNLRYRPYSSGIVAPGLNFVVSLQLTI